METSQKGLTAGKIEQRGVVYNPTNKAARRFYYIMNGIELPTHYMQAGVSKRTGGASGYGSPGAFFNENAKPMPTVRTFPHKHVHTEYFIIFGSDPDNPDDLGGTIEFWLGEGEEAEPFLITKPTTILVPPKVVHLPQAYREARRPMCQIVVYDSTLWSCYQVPKVPPGFDLEKQVIERAASEKKYKNCVNERDVSNAAIFPSHKGKSQVMLQHDVRQNELAPHWIEINLISGSGIGWGCGDIMQFPEYEIQSLPHFHDVVETYCFFGTDPDNQEDLGGTVEFWVGGGAEAKEYIIRKPTILLIPPNMTHLPLYVREVHNPFVAASILDTPLWSGIYTDVFPTGFEHI